MVNRNIWLKSCNRFCIAMSVISALMFGGYAFALDERTPEAIVEETSSSIMKTINEENARLREDPALINELINDTVIPIIDLDSVSYTHLTLPTTPYV